MKRLIFTISLFTFFGLNLIGQQSSQMLINKVWEQAFGQPNDFDWAASIIDNSGNLITTGHATIDQNNTELLLVKQDQEGTTLWDNNFKITQNTKNYGTAIASDNLGNIFVAGITNENGIDAQNDFVLLKYSSSGTKVWHSKIDGIGSGNDIPTKVITDNVGNLYVTGLSLGDGTQLDYFTLKINANNGNTIWEQRYDYNNLFDIPVDLSINNNGNLVVVGASAQSLTNWEIAILEYSPSGNQINEVRLDNANIGFDKPSGLAKDNNGNLFITGTTSIDGENQNIKTVKLDAQLDILWSQEFDHSKVDSVSAIQVDALGNVFVTGWSSNSTYGSTIVTLKYDNTGELLWSKHWYAPSTSMSAKARNLTLDSNGNIYVVGEVSSTEKSQITVICYSSDGNIRWSKSLFSNNFEKNNPNGIFVTSNNEVFVSAIGKSDVQKQHLTFKLEQYERQLIPIFENGEPSHAQNEAIINFDPVVLNTATIDDRDKTYGQLEDFISDTNLIAEIRDRLRLEERDEILATKIYQNLSTASSEQTYQSRLGRDIQMPKFWTSLVVIFPNSVDLYDALDELNDRTSPTPIFPKIRYAGANLIVQLDGIVPNDTHYAANQESLHPTSAIPDAHINVEGAWALDAKGDGTVKVGVFDTGILYDHDDLSKFNTWESSKVDGGKDYTVSPNVDIQNINGDLDGHGTKCAGIIGAFRNNQEIGIAGIAGGDVDDDNNDGVIFYAMKVFPGNGAFPYIDGIVEGIQDGLPGGSYSLDITNNSWSITPNASLNNSYSIAELKKVIRYASESEVVMVASRGNNNSDDFSYPSTYYPDWQTGDDWVISCGGSDATGERWNPANPFSGSNFGKQLDVMAPSTPEIVYTTDNVQSGYSSFDGTSAAAPHVTGVASILMAYHNTPLAPEDVEHLLEYAAIDKGATGYDTETGWGLINAGDAVSLIEKSEYRVVHFEAQSTSPTSEGFNQQCEMIGDYDIYPEGHQWMDIKKYTATVNHNLPPTASIVSATGKPGYWVRNSGSNLWGPIVNGNLLPETNVQFEGTPTIESATLVGYHYGIRFVPNEPVIVPYTANPDGGNYETPTMAYSLLIHDPDFMTSTSSLLDQSNSMSLSPNPTDGTLSIHYHLQETTMISIDILSINGQKVQSINLGLRPKGEHIFQMNLSELPAGMYWCTLRTTENILQQKFVKTN